MYPARSRQVWAYAQSIWSISNSYTMGCPPVHRDNPQALASGLSYLQVDNHDLITLYHLHR